MDPLRSECPRTSDSHHNLGAAAPRGAAVEADFTFSSFGVSRGLLARCVIPSRISSRGSLASLLSYDQPRVGWCATGPRPRPTRQPTARAQAVASGSLLVLVPSAGARPIGLRRGCGHQPMLPARVCIGVGYWCGVGRPRASRSGAARLGPAALSRARRGTVRVSPCSKAPGALVGASVNSSDPLETEGGGTLVGVHL